MDSVKELLTSYGFWIGVVIFGVLINLTSAYLKTRLDSALSSISRRWATRSKKRQQERAERIRILRLSLAVQTVVRFVEMRHRLNAITFLLFSVFFLVMAYMIETPVENEVAETIASIVLLLLAVMGLLLGFGRYMDAVRTLDELVEANKPENQSDPKPDSTQEGAR